MEHLILVVILKIEAQFHFASKVETVISLYL